MPVTFDDIISASSSEESFLEIFQNTFSRQDQPFLEAHHTILTAYYRNPGLSPTMQGNTPEVLAQSWLRRYCDSYQN